MNEYEFIAGFTKGFSDSVADKIGKAPAKTFNSIWDIVFGGVDSYAEKIAHERALDVQKFKDSLENKVMEIPRENIQEPQLSLLGPALESTKYYISDESLRELFINLIAKSIDDRYSGKMNHSFVEIIKQMSPTDAAILKYIYRREYVATAKIVATFNNTDAIPLTDYYFLFSNYDNNAISLSLNNLNRLGLIELPEYTPLFPDKLYNEFLIHEPFNSLNSNNKFKRLSKEFKRDLELHGEDLYNVALNNSVGIDEVKRFKEYSGIQLIKTNTSLSTYGKALAEVCLTD